MSVLKRFWRYRYSSWRPYWWNWIVPYRGADEFGRLTLVFHVPFVGFIAWAWKTCYCAECEESRAWNAAHPCEEEI